MVLEMMVVVLRIGNALVRLVLVVAWLVLVRQAAQGYSAGIVPDEIRSDAFGLRAKEVILGCSLLLSLVRPVGHTFKSAFLFVSSLLGAMIVLDSTGFISLFMGIEMLSLPAFALIVHGAGTTAVGEGAFKYLLLLSSVASALLLFGIALAYGGTGTLTIVDFAALMAHGSPLGVAAGILVVSGLFLKAALFPFHGWGAGRVRLRAPARHRIPRLGGEGCRDPRAGAHPRRRGPESGGSRARCHSVGPVDRRRRQRRGDPPADLPAAACLFCRSLTQGTWCLPWSTRREPAPTT